LAYRKDLKHFFCFTAKEFNIPQLDGKALGFDEIKRVHVVRYKKYLETTNCLRQKPYAPNSVNRKLSFEVEGSAE